jgi:hypothetical protein
LIRPDYFLTRSGQSRGPVAAIAAGRIPAKRRKNLITKNKKALNKVSAS